jgi:hypothetical protein
VSLPNGCTLSLAFSVAAPAEHRLVWDGKRNDGELLPPGLYLCKVCIGSHCKVEKVVLLR